MVEVVVCDGSSVCVGYRWEANSIGAMLAATIVSLLVLAILNLAILPTFNVNFSGARAGTNNCLLDNQNRRGSPLLVSLETCLPQLNVSRRVVKVLDSYCRVHHIRRPLYRLSKRGMTSLAVPGHDPPTDITISWIFLLTRDLQLKINHFFKSLAQRKPKLIYALNAPLLCCPILGMSS